MRPTLRLLVFVPALLVLGACGDDATCTRLCPPGQACVLSGGEELCLAADCGGVACAPGTDCVNDVCVADQSCADCTDAQHCVSAVCVDNYTGANVCDPLRQCRAGCGTNARCLDACELDESATCSSCLEVLASCEQSDNCDSGAVNGCCEAQFCDCFPSAPGCGNVSDCVECQQDCGDNVSCFNDCRRTDLACNLCLQPFDDCVEATSAAECVEEFCNCLDSDLEPDCR